MIEILLYSVLIMLASLVGVFSVWHRAYQLGIEAVEHADTLGSGLIWITIGVLSVWLLFKFLPSSHHHHDQTLETRLHSRLDARRIMASDAFHNMGDGILLATSFAVSPSLGILTALSIFVHELVQEISEFFVLRQAGYSTKQTLVLNFAISASILLGVLGGFFLLESFEIFEVPLLGLASGAFLVVVFHDLIPHSVRASKQKNLYRKHLLWFLIGVVLMFILNILAVH